MRLSKFSRVYEFIYEDSSYYVIRHSITNKSFFLKKEEFEKLMSDLRNKSENPDIETLKGEHILVPDNYSEAEFAGYLKKLYNLNKFDLEIIYLIFNTKCNLQCKYCYVEGSTKSDFRHLSMDQETFNDIMSYLDKLITYHKKTYPDKNKLTFVYYGSEPLMSRKFFMRSLEIIKEICDRNNIIADFQITTNGTLLNEEVAEAMKKFRVGVSISLDGKKPANDSMRVYLNGSGTYDKIVSAISLLKSKNIPFGISCTIGPHNAEKLNENAEHFIELGASSVGFNILLNARYSDTPLIPLTVLNDNLLEASKKVGDFGFYEDRIQRKVRAFSGIPRFKDCGGVGNQLVFFPNGDIGACEAYLCNPGSKVGNIKETDVKDIEKSQVLRQWTERYPLNMEECLYCPALGICGGGCPFNAETISGKGIYQRDKPFCVHTNKALNWLLKDSVDKKTGKKDPYCWDITFMHSQEIF